MKNISMRFPVAILFGSARPWRSRFLSRRAASRGGAGARSCVRHAAAGGRRARLAAASGDTAALLAIFGPEGEGNRHPRGIRSRTRTDMQKFAEGPREEAGDLDPGRTGDDRRRRGRLAAARADRSKRGKWRFDSRSGAATRSWRGESEDELDAIELLRGYVEAQWAYASRAARRERTASVRAEVDEHPGQARRPGVTRAARPPDLSATGSPRRSPRATRRQERALQRLLLPHPDRPGPGRPAGTRDYVVKGVMIGGFAAVAWPANYEVTGIQTFQVNYDGAVYQKDLGRRRRPSSRPKIKQFNPDKTWTVTEDAE